ncbi:nitrogen regulatory IIA protein [Sphingobacterium multivorum]|uniref:nitrogen regulatory IIA protein n=1 Tax=Sphingobacterium multivorum TaxID=28454 RepID=UPI002FD8C1D2
MKNIRTTIDKELEKLDLRWRNLPVRTQIRYVLYLFAFYLVMGVGVLVKVFYDLGRGDKMTISHIEVPAAIHNGASVKDSVTNPKDIENGRERE